MTRVLVLIGAWSAELGALIARELGDGSRIVCEPEPPRIGLDTLDGLLAGLDYGRCPVAMAAEHEPPYERHSEAGMLRRENLWREKRARAMFNVRANADRRLRKQMRGIGRR